MICAPLPVQNGYERDGKKGERERGGKGWLTSRNSLAPYHNQPFHCEIRKKNKNKNKIYRNNQKSKFFKKGDKRDQIFFL